jgi:signal transduction histidine kinase
LILLKERGTFNWRQREKARLAVYLIAVILQERRLIQALRPWQARNLVGQLLNSVVHEITNKLGGLEYQVDALQEGLRELSMWPEKANDATFLRKLEQAAERIAHVQQSSRELRNRYLGLTGHDEPQMVDLETLTEEMVGILHPEAQQHNVFVQVVAPKRLPLVWARPIELRQIFLNVLLNAIQQMALLGRGGNLCIEIVHVPGVSHPVQVRFRDEGLGIHFQLWERVFDFGFTTKEDGAGLGLTISRQIAARLGGRLRVEESCFFWGTVFLLELPAGRRDEGPGGA